MIDRGSFWPAFLSVAALSLAGAAPAAAQAPAQDSVVGSLTEIGATPPGYDLDVSSGPSGENVTGTFTFRFLGLLPAEPVCLQVSGNRATVVAVQQNSFVVAFKVTVVDAPPGEPDQGGSAFFFSPAVLPDCTTPLPTAPATGSVVVTDAQPSPTTKEQCKNGGWLRYGMFRNQGDCVSFVATKGRDHGPAPL